MEKEAEILVSNNKSSPQLWCSHMNSKFTVDNQEFQHSSVPLLLHMEIAKLLISLHWDKNNVFLEDGILSVAFCKEMMYLMHTCYVPCRRILGPPSSHEVAISTSVTAANAKKRLPPMYAIIFSDRNVPSKEPPRTAINVATP